MLLFVAIAGSFKAIMIGQFTDSMLGHLEVHRKGYVASIDSLPLNLNMQPQMVGKVEQVLDRMDAVEAYSRARQARRHVQQLHRDHQRAHQRRGPGEGSRHHAPAARAHRSRAARERPAAEAGRDPDPRAARARA